MFELKKINNGIKLLSAPISGTETVTVLVMVATGSKYENKNNNGISHFLEHMFFKGTFKRPSAIALSSELDSIGGVYNAFTTKEFTGYWIKVDALKVEKSMEIISDMLLNSKFSKEEIEKEKGVVIEELNMYRDNPMIYIEDVFENLLYGDQPAGWDIIGTKETILKFRREDIISYINSQYGAQNIIISLAGNLKNIKAEKLAYKFFSKIKKSESCDKIEVKEIQKKPQTKIIFKDTDQAHLSLGVRTYASGHKYEYILKIISIILGGSMSSRLFVRLREKEGLCYYVKNNSEIYTDTGYLTTQAGVPADKVKKVIEIILDEYKKLKTTLVGNEELKRVKDMIKGRLAIQLEASDNIATWYTKQVIMKEKILTPKNYLKVLNSINSGDIRMVAREIFKNERLNFAIISKIKDNKELMRVLTI